jgi:hypothetical protein
MPRESGAVQETPESQPRDIWGALPRAWIEAPPQSRLLWLFSFGSGALIPLAGAVSVLLLPHDRESPIIGFAVAYMAVMLSLLLRGIVLSARKR